ncbi:hypothetical protein MBLNU457_6570t1 [Dothideomycetes sp. NU457]
MNWTTKVIAFLFAAGQTQALVRLDRDGQAILNEEPWKASDSQKLAPTMTVNVHSSATATYEAECASLHIEVSAKNETEHVARAAWKTAADLVAEIVESTASVTEWKQSPSRTWNSKDEFYSRRYIDDSEDRSPSVSNHFEVKVENPDMVASLKKRLAGIENVGARWISWELSEEHTTAAKMATSKAAIKDCLKVGQRYADALEYSNLELVGIDERYDYLSSMEDEENVRVTRAEEDVDFKPQKVQAFTEVICNIRLF